jgi:hypothetical protein
VAQPLITGREVRRLALLAGAMVLVAAAVNGPVAVLFSKDKRFSPPASSVVRKPVVRATWPASTPHDRAWPPPSSWDEARGFGWRYFNVLSPPTSANQNGFSMTVRLAGWPLPVIEDKQMWWNWSDPTLAGPVPDPAISLRWSGVVLNPLIVSGGAFLLLAGAPMSAIIARRAGRRRKGQCSSCGYPAGVSAVCTECGAALRG